MDLFDRFWQAYPRHEAKLAARREFAKLKVDEPLLEAMLTWLNVARRSDQWRDKRFIPHPSTWLHQKRWEDDPPPMSRELIDAQVGSSGNGHDEVDPEALQEAVRSYQEREKRAGEKAIADHARGILNKPLALRTKWECQWLERWRKENGNEVA